jgi:hypothetical protein
MCPPGHEGARPRFREGKVEKLPKKIFSAHSTLLKLAANDKRFWRSDLDNRAIQKSAHGPLDGSTPAARAAIKYDHCCRELSWGLFSRPGVIGPLDARLLSFQLPCC